MLMILTVVALSEISVQIPPIKISNSIIKGTGKILITLSLICLFTYCSIQYKATFTWKEADSNNLQNNSYSLNLFDNVYPLLKHRSNFLFNYGVRLYQMGQYIRCIYLLEECRRIQSRVDLFLYLGMAYQQTSVMLTIN